MIESLPALRRQFLADGQTFHAFPDDDPRRARPLSLEQQKKRAKDLLARWRASAAAPHRPARGIEATSGPPDGRGLADAQHAIAREAGFASWAKLKHHIQAADLAREALRSGQPPSPDADRRTLHIRCGHDVMYKLAVAGFQGDFLAFADPYIQGPVPHKSDTGAFIRVRADFIAAQGWRTAEQAYGELAGDYRSLEQGRDYERIAFWFEHDAYDVLILLKLLHFYRDPARRAPDMRYVCVDRYPGVARFNGIGQLPAEAMRVLWEQFQPLTEDQFAYGAQCWQAYTASTPEAFLELATRPDAPLPAIVHALKRHLEELPWLGDGLSLSERITLRILLEHGPMDAAGLFYHWYTTVHEPLPFMGDSGYWLVLDALAQAPHPAITLAKPDRKPTGWRVSLTPFGRQLLAGQAHWTRSNPYERWWGGLRNGGGGVVWYWDGETGRVVSAPVT